MVKQVTLVTVVCLESKENVVIREHVVKRETKVTQELMVPRYVCARVCVII